MEYIIQQITEDLARNILEKSLSGKIHDIDDLADELLGDCKTAASKMLTVILEHMNDELRKDKRARKELGLVLQDKGRERVLLTSLGQLEWKRDYYLDTNRGAYCYPLDEMIGVRPYERIGDAVSAKMLNAAAEVSYAKSAEMVTGGAVSRQTVRNKLLKLEVPEKELPKKRQEVRELHVYADEDHAHMQRPGKEKGKRSQRIPFVTVGEGLEKVSEGRNAVVNPMHFVDERFDTKELWRSVSGYIGAAYDAANLEKIYVHGDGGKWIKSGLREYVQTEHVMDLFHLAKRVRSLSLMFPERNVRIVILSALKANDRRRADRFLCELQEEAGSEKERCEVRDFGKYLFGSWEENMNSLKEDNGGSCTEGQVSHLLSERVSRDPLGWSREGLGKLTKVRISVKNGRPIESSDFKTKERQAGYAQYADQLIEESMRGAKDWSLFERELPIFDTASGTQTIIHALGAEHGLLS